MRTTPQRDGHAPTASASPSPNTADPKRRRFLFALGAGSAAGAAAAAQAIAAPVVGEAAAPLDAASASGYRETEHVRDYYKSARI